MDTRTSHLDEPKIFLAWKVAWWNLKHCARRTFMKWIKSQDFPHHFFWQNNEFLEIFVCKWTCNAALVFKKSFVCVFLRTFLAWKFRYLWFESVTRSDRSVEKWDFFVELLYAVHEIGTHHSFSFFIIFIWDVTKYATCQRHFSISVPKFAHAYLLLDRLHKVDCFTFTLRCIALTQKLEFQI